MTCYFDNRWIGSHGIGRFAAMLAERIPFTPLNLSGKHSHPLDPLRLAFALQKKSAPNLFFSPGYTTPAFGKSPYIFCLHDLIHLECPEAKSFAKSLYYQTVIKRACHHAEFVLTVSEYSRSRILKWSGLPDWKVVQVGNGVDADFQPEGASYPFSKPYLLCVSNRRPHKNEPRLLKAFAQAKGLGEMPLLLTGKASAELQSLAHELQIENRIHFLGWIPESMLPSLYRGAHALIFPSLYEGFGLPVAEAMACGIPVLTSTTTSLPEVGGDAVLLADPYSINDIAHGIERIVTDSELRKTLRTRGLKRASLFTWDATADRVRTVLGKVATQYGAEL